MLHKSGLKSGLNSFKQRVSQREHFAPYKEEDGGTGVEAHFSAAISE
jgi:hypothetical protein